jgi:hypothetical protein
MSRNFDTNTARVPSSFFDSTTYFYGWKNSESNPDKDFKVLFDDIKADVRGEAEFTAGSVFFAGATGQLDEDNDNLFYDDTLNRLGILTNTPNYELDVQGQINGNEYFLQDISLIRFGNTNDDTSPFVGKFAGVSQTSPTLANTGMGFGALRDNTTGNSCSAFTSNSNAAFGVSSLSAIAAGSNNNASFGSRAGQGLTSGANNTFLGNNAGAVIETGSNNICIGHNSGNLTGLTTRNFGLAIGTEADLTADNQAVIGSTTMALDNFHLGRGVSTSIALSGELVLQPTSVIDGQADTGTTYDFVVAGGKGTGTGSGSSVSIKTSPSGAAGSTQNPLVEAARFDTNQTAGETRFLLYDITAGTTKRVSIGAVDSGGVGFKVLRVPN